jgi:putative membrane protein
MIYYKKSFSRIFYMGLISFLFSTVLFAQTVLTDPEIAHIVVTANNVDITAGKLAKEKSKNKGVTEFAERMIVDHSGVNKQATELVTKLGVKPANNETSKGLVAGGKTNIKILKKLSGKKFDKHYVDQEVTYHEMVLDTIDKMLIPNSQNAELKALIEKVRPAIAAHLEHAKTLQSAMANN